MKKTLLIIVIFMIYISLFAENPDQTKNKNFLDPVGGFGIGSIYQASIHSHFKHNYISFKCISEDLFTSSPPFNREFILLYGRTYNLNTKLKGFISASLGIGINQKYYYLTPGYDNQQLQKEYSAGIPLDFNIIKGLTPMIGYGINATFNLHNIKTLGSAFFSIYVGNFHNYDYKPDGKKIIPKIDYKITLPAVIDSSNIITKNNIALEFNWLYFVALTGLKNNFCFTFKDINFVIALQSREEKSNEIYDQYSIVRSLGFKVRSYFPKSGWFYDYGLHYLSMCQDNYNNTDENHWQNSTNAFLSFGYQYYFRPNLYVKSQINAFIPFMGDDISYNGYGVLSDAMLMDFDILSLGYNFSNLID